MERRDVQAYFCFHCEKLKCESEVKAHVYFSVLASIEMTTKKPFAD